MIERLALASIAALFLVGCHDFDEKDDATHERPSLATVNTSTVSEKPNSTTPDEDKGEAGARTAVQAWATALEDRNFEAAWGQFLHPPASREAFVKWWARYSAIRVDLGAGSSDAAAGSLYYSVPVTLTGALSNGQTDRLSGSVIARRVNDVEGASADQLRWHIQSANLQKIPVQRKP